MNFISKIQAIHPRGRKWEKKEEPKKGFSLPKGKTVKQRLDWIAASVDDMITDYDFSPKTNALMHEIKSLHGFVTDSLDLESQLQTYLRLATLAGDLGKAIKTLYAKGSLPKHVDRKMVHTLLDVIKETEQGREILEQHQVELKRLQSKLKALGF